MIKRSSGILMNISSLPNPYGIGTFGIEAYEFIDFLVKAGQKYWQILPLGATSFGDSPYQSFSAFAGNPYFIDFDFLNKEGILNRQDYNTLDFGENLEKIDYEKIFTSKMDVLRMAFNKSNGIYRIEIEKFKANHRNWLEDYALYMSIKQQFDLVSWQYWDEDIKLREQKALDKYKDELSEEIEYWVFLQYLFFKQYGELKEYANSKGIKIIGDVPIYVAEDSADAWSKGEIFLLDKKMKPIVVSGCPPDAFSSTGQLWGNPIYNWEQLEKEGYKWWIDRISANIKLYDAIRVDHFRGFESYWEIPCGDKTAENGTWVKGPGMKLFNAIKEALGEVNIIAEDLGFLTEEVIDFRMQSGYPGMKVLQFAFESTGESDYLPHNYEKNCVVYTGTHDNDTVNGWFRNTSMDDVAFAVKYLTLNEDEGYNWGFIRGALSSVGNLAIAQMQDYLGLGEEHRMNRPSTLGENWKWRVKKESLDDKLANEIYKLTKRYGR